MQVFLLQAMSSEPRFTRLQALAWLAQVLESLSAKLLIPYGEALIYLVHSAADPRLLVGPSGLEPPTSCLSGTRSNHLSYEPSFRGAPDGIYRAYSPLSFLLSTTILLGVKGSLRFYLFRLRIRMRWWRWWDSNPWPPACRAGALPAELHPRICSSQILGFCFFSVSFFKEVSLVSFLFKESNW